MALTDTLKEIEKQVADVKAKQKAHADAELAYNKASSDLSASRNKLEALRTEVHDALGNALSDNPGRVRQTS